MSDFKFPTWRQRLARSLHVNRSQAQSKYFQVATVSMDGLPKNRTMVFRGFVPDSLNLLSVTDIRSDKVADWKLSTPKKFEICWYFAGSREQYRVAGHVSLVSSELIKDAKIRNPERQAAYLSHKFLREQWQNLSGAAKAQFFWPTPKAPFESESDTEDLSQRPENVDEDISDNFCVVIFTPLTVDYLNLKNSPQLRCLSDFENDWLEVVVNA